MIIADGNSNGDTACRNADENRSIAKSLISKLNLAAESENYASRDDSQISKGNGATTAIRSSLICLRMHLLAAGIHYQLSVYRNG
ncbi:hypothetical protein Ancab_035762 [Ancistrocladus abbreviatus]